MHTAAWLRAWCVGAALLASIDPLSSLGRRGAPWARRELARRAEQADRAYVASLPPPLDVGALDVKLVRVEPDRVLAVAGTVRLVVRGAGFTAARERTRSAIVAAVPLANARWIFATRAGDAFRSPSFEGPLTWVGRVERPLGHAHPSEGRLVIEDSHGRLWTTAGDAPPVALDRAMMTASFVDASRGAAIARRGGLFVTSDGGASWQPHALGVEAAYALRRDARGLVAATSAGDVLLHATADAGLPARVRDVDETHRALEAGRVALPTMHLRLAPTGPAPVAPDDTVPDSSDFGSIGIAGFGLGNTTRFGVAADTETTAPTPAWAPPAFTIQHRTRGVPQWQSVGLRESGAHAEPLARVDAMRRIDAMRGSAAVALSPIATSSEVELAWRRLDADGVFTRRARVPLAELYAAARRTPPSFAVVDHARRNYPQTALVAATRAGLILASNDDERWFDLLYVVADGGARRLPHGAFDLGGAAAIARPDGGAWVIATSGEFPPLEPYPDLGRPLAAIDAFQARLTIVLEVSPDGTIVHRRAFARPTREDAFEGLFDDAAGVAYAQVEPATPFELTVVRIDDGATSTLPLPESHGVVRGCGRAVGAWTLHAFPGTIDTTTVATIGPIADGPSYAEVTRVDYERADAGLCVRRIEASGEVAWSAAYNDDRSVVPRAGIQLVSTSSTTVAGRRDDGRTVMNVGGEITVHMQYADE